MEEVVSANKNILGGTPCFAGTRVPVASLFDHLEGGHTIDYFLEQFPTVRREQVIALLEAAKQQTELDSHAGTRLAWHDLPI